MVLDLSDCEECTSERMDTKIHIIFYVYHNTHNAHNTHNVYLPHMFMVLWFTLIHIKLYIIRSRNYKLTETETSQIFSQMFGMAKNLRVVCLYFKWNSC